MERKTSLVEAKEIMGVSFIGPNELAKIANKMGIERPSEIPIIPFSPEELKNKKRDYILILGISQMKNGEPLTLRTLRDQFGIDPDTSEPCFYNQDWYLKEEFINESLISHWYLLRKTLFNDSRGKNFEDLKELYSLPSAILCAYTFFCNWFHAKEILWQYDFVWCKNTDHNKDQIYVGKYIDIAKINKNGFSIHRHLALRDFYGCIDAI